MCCALMVVVCLGVSLPLAAQSDTPTPPTPIDAATEPAANTPITLRLWLPEPLSPVEDAAASAILTDLLVGFEGAHPGISVELRLRRPNDVGGIMETLRTASAVAPGALPDLTLMRRSDLLEAAESNLIQPLPPTSLLDDLPSAVVSLGLVDGVLYGIPYLVELQHAAYDPDFTAIAAPADGWALEMLIDAEVSFTFPVGRVNSRSDMLIAQYLSDGGSADALDSDLLLRLLRLYERAANAGLIDLRSLEYTTPEDYRARLAGGTIRAGLVTSGMYLDLLDMGTALDPAPIPTASGGTAAALDGWMWVLPTANPDRRTAALRLLDWMMNADRQARYSRSLSMLPSGRSALRTWSEIEPLDGSADYADFVRGVLENAVLPDTMQATPARAMQTALIAVLRGERTAELALQDVLTQLGE
jgi:ABC-type glycerol-3-phosphate transport system substrate-binding protein